ncbi:MAG: MGMT family protein [Candidatus Cloacimonetes bacterium]|nr:MGMT family protein [Candidatus Cloacimonadota bacterium]
MGQPSRTYELIWETVKLIPPGKVATYGQIAREAGLPMQARLVGYALHSLPEDHNIPWHRVINARGTISLKSDGGKSLQQSMLEAEGVRFDENGRLDLKKYRWR